MVIRSKVIHLGPQPSRLPHSSLLSAVASAFALKGYGGQFGEVGGEGVVLPFFHFAGKSNDPLRHAKKHGLKCFWREFVQSDQGIQLGKFSFSAFGRPKEENCASVREKIRRITLPFCGEK